MTSHYCEQVFWEVDAPAFGYVPPAGACGGEFAEIVNCLPITGQCAPKTKAARIVISLVSWCF